MREYIVFFDVQSPHFLPLLQGVAARGFTPILTGGPLAEECRRAGLGFRRWEAYTPPDLPLRLDRELKRRLTDLAQACQAPAVRRAFATRRGDFLSSIHQPFVQQLVQILTLELSALETFRRLEGRHRPRLVVLGCDNSPSQRALVLAAAQSGIPTLQLAHGMLGPTWGRVAGEMHTLYSRYLAAYGRRSRDFLVSQGNPPERIFLTGAPLWDHLYLPESRLNPAEAKTRLGLDPARPVVLFTTSYADGSSAFFPAILRRHRAIHDEVLEAVARLGGEVQLLVRPHPQEVGRVGLSGEQTAALDRLYLEYAAQRYGAQVHLLRSHKLEALAAAEVVLVTGQSSVIPEAMIVDKPVISLALFPEEPRTYSREDGVWVLEGDEELPRVLTDLLQDEGLRETLRQRRQQALPDINYGHDGRAAGRVVSLISELAADNPAPLPKPRPSAPRTRPPGLKLLFATHNFLPYNYAGTEIYTRDLALAMQARGHEVRVLYPRPVAKPPGDTEVVLQQGCFEGLQVAELVYPMPAYVDTRLDALKPVVQSFLAAYRPDLVHIQHLMGLTVSFLEVLKELNIPVVMTVNDYWLLCNQVHLVQPGGVNCEGPDTVDKCVHCLARYLNQQDEGALPKYFYYQAERQYTNRRATRLPDLLLFPSRFQLANFQRFHFVNDHMVHLPQGASLFTPRPREDYQPSRLRFAFLGTICYRKGLDLLVEAFNRIQSRGAELHLYGSIAEPEYFENIKKTITPGKAVVYHGAYSPGDLPDILAKTDVAVVPSRGENFPFVIREILHAGVPVIAAAVAGIPEIIRHGENGLLFQPNNAADLAERLKEVISAPELLAQLRAGIRPVKSMAQDAEDIEALYRQVLSRRREAAGTQPAPASVEAPAEAPGEPPLTTSIIIPVFNNLELNRQCLDSLYRHTDLRGVEIIVVDNASSDGSTEFLAGEEAAGRLRLLRNSENLGFSKACNQGARAARGENLLFLNNDTIVTPGWLEGLERGLAAADRIGVVGGKLLYPDDTIQHAGVAFDEHKRVDHIYRGFHRDHPAVNKPREFQVVTAACMLIRRDLFFATGGFDENYRNGFEDVDLCLKIRQLGYRVFYTPECVVYHLESKTPGRHANEKENFNYFISRWHDYGIISDLTNYYKEDGISYEFLEIKNDEYFFIMRDQYVTNLWFKARTLKKQGLFSDAIESYKKALSSNPYDYRQYIIMAELAETLEMLGKEEEALEYYHILVNNTSNPKNYYLLGRLLKKLGRLEEAAAYLEKAKAGLKGTAPGDEETQEKSESDGDVAIRAVRSLPGGSVHEECASDRLFIV